MTDTKIESEERLDIIRRVMGDAIYGLWNHLGREEYSNRDEADRSKVSERDYVRDYIERRFAADPKSRMHQSLLTRS